MGNLLRNTYYRRLSAEQFSFLHVESGRLVSQHDGQLLYPNSQPMILFGIQLSTALQ